MMKKTILTMGLAAMLTVPAGIALAQVDDEAVGDETTVTTVAPAQVRDQARVQDPTECDGTCPRLTDEYMIQDQDQLRTQQRLHDPALCDGEGDQLRQQLRLHVSEAGGNGPEAGYGQGGNGPGGYGAGVGDGTGPIHEAAGAGNQFGLAG